MNYRWLMTFALFVAACGASPEELAQTMVAQTATAATATPAPTLTSAPTPAPTPVPLSEIDLASMLVRDGDLPAGHHAAQYRTLPPDALQSLPAYDNYAGVQLERNNDVAGLINVWLFARGSHKASAVAQLLERFETVETINGIGSAAYGHADASYATVLVGLEPYRSTWAMFERCSAVAYFWFNQVDDMPGAIAYAQRLDARLKEVVCR